MKSEVEEVRSEMKAPTPAVAAVSDDSRQSVTWEILRNSFGATVRQAGRIIQRSSFSPVIRDGNDFCVTLIAPPRHAGLDLELIAMSESLAHFAGVIPFMVRNLFWEYGEENLEPGDLIAINNPYLAGNHVYDNGFVKPVFVDGHLVGAIAAKAHLVDVGGVAAGGFSVEKRNIFEEGIVLSGIPIYKADKPWTPGFNLYFDNSRLPENMFADVQAVYNGCRFGEERLLALIHRYGQQTVHDAMAYSLDYADRSMRTALAALPDGEYFAEDGLDADPYSDLPYRINCVVRKHDDQLEIDLSGSSAQSDASINCPVYDAANGAY